MKDVAMRQVASLNKDGKDKKYNRKRRNLQRITQR